MPDPRTLSDADVQAVAEAVVVLLTQTLIGGIHAATSEPTPPKPERREGGW